MNIFTYFRRNRHLEALCTDEKFINFVMFNKRLIIIIDKLSSNVYKSKKYEKINNINK